MEVGVKKILFAVAVLVLTNPAFSRAQSFPSPTLPEPMGTIASTTEPPVTKPPLTDYEIVNACFAKCDSDYAQCVVDKATMDCFAASPSCNLPLQNTVACSAEVAACLAGIDFETETDIRKSGGKILDYPIDTVHEEILCILERHKCDLHCAYLPYRLKNPTERALLGY